MIRIVVAALGALPEEWGTAQARDDGASLREAKGGPTLFLGRTARPVCRNDHGRRSTARRSPHEQRMMPVEREIFDDGAGGRRSEIPARRGV